MPPSIPASQLVQVTPSVLGAGGNPLSLNAIFLTTNATLPYGEVVPFSTLTDVQDFFGASSAEYTFAAVYFAGYEQGTSLPSTLYFYRFNLVGIAGWLRSGSHAGGSLADIQALSGVLTVAIDGRIVTSASVNLSGATSFSNAAALLQTGLQTTGGIFGGTANQTALSTTMTVTAVGAGALHVGDVIVGTGVTAGTTIVSQDSGTPGGAGDYTVDNDDGFASTTITVTSGATVTYNSQLHAFQITSNTTGEDSTLSQPSVNDFSTGLKFTQLTGDVISAGAETATAAGAFALITAQTQNWASFTTTFKPDQAVMLDLASYVTTSNDRYAYVAWDDNAEALAADATDSFGVLTANYDGVIPVYNPDGKIAAFICGTIASINFSQLNGRITFAYKSQAGLVADITDATEANNLISNGYNFYGAYATANDSFTFLQPGKISGDWLWIDEYINQIQLNSALQLAFMSLLASVPSIPYNQSGYGLIRAAALDPISATVDFGTIRAGVRLSNSQAAQVNSAAGLNISGTLSQVGWYLQILDATAQARADRESPPMTLWYMSGGSVQKINLASIDVL